MDCCADPRGFCPCAGEFGCQCDKTHARRDGATYSTPPKQAHNTIGPPPCPWAVCPPGDCLPELHAIPGLRPKRKAPKRRDKGISLTAIMAMASREFDSRGKL